MPSEPPPDRPRSTPPGEGWDDGRGNRPAKAGRATGDRSSRRRGAPRRGGTGAARRPAGDGRPPTAGARAGTGFGAGLAGLPRWSLGVAAAVVVLLLALVVTRCGGGGSSDAGSCLTDLSAALPEESRFAYGSDLVQARNEGYVDDGELEELGTSQVETGAIPDPLTQQFRFGQLVSAEAFTAKTGVEPGQVRCSLSDVERSVMSGSFDVAEVSGSSVADEGRLAAAEDRLGLTSGDADPEKLLTDRDGGGLGSNEDYVRVLESLREGDAYSVVVQVGNPRAEKRARAAGVGVGSGEGDGRTLVLAWAYADDEAAKAGRTDVVDAVNRVLAGTSQIGSEDLTVDGSLVTATVDVRKAPQLAAIYARQLALIPGD